MKKIVFILSATASVCVMSCRTNDKPSHKEELIREAAKSPYINISSKQYFINVPSGWRETDTLVRGVSHHMIFTPKDDNTFQSNLDILNENMQGLPLDDFAKSSFNLIQSAFESFQLLEQGPFKTNNNVEAKWFRFSYTNNGYNLEGIMYIIPIDGIAYELIGRTTSGNLDKNKKDFDAIAKSFYLK